MRLVKKGKRTYGAFFDLPNGKKVYCAFRTPAMFFLDGKLGEFKSIAKGIEDGSAAWAIDEHQLLKCKSLGIDYVAVWVKKLNWLWITPLSTFYDRSKYYRRNYGSRGGSEQRYVSVKHWVNRSRDASIGPTTRV